MICLLRLAKGAGASALTLNGEFTFGGAVTATGLSAGDLGNSACLLFCFELFMALLVLAKGASASGVALASLSKGVLLLFKDCTSCVVATEELGVILAFLSAGLFFERLSFGE